MKNSSCLVAAFLLFCLPVFSQKKELKTKFGKISDEEIAMQSYQNDPAAPAVVLFDKGEVTHDFVDNLGFVFKFERHARIKIFKKEAYDMANVVIAHFSWQKINDLKAVCYQFEGGKTTEIKISNDNIFTDKLTKSRWLKKITIPGVREGCIIEFKYTIVDDDIIDIPNWIFQKIGVPTIWSEFEAAVPTFIQFQKMSQGEGQFSLAEEDSKRQNLSISMASRGGPSAGGVQYVKVNYEVKTMHFIQENVPALKPESFVPAPKDFLAQINFDIRAVYRTEIVPDGDTYRLSNTTFKTYNNSWEKLGKELLEDVYEDAMKSGKYSKDAVANCIAGKTTNAEKVAAIYENIGQNFQSKNLDFPWLSQSLETLSKDRKGTATDLNLLFINMLRKADVNAWPVLLSTRENGKLHPTRVSVEGFSRVIVAVQMDDAAPILVDVSAFPNPIGLLPKEDLNGEGLLLKSEELVEWIPLQNKISSRTAVLATFNLNPEGGMNGNVSYSESGFGAVSSRSKMKEKDAQSLVQETFKDWLADGKCTDLKTENLENWQMPNVKIDFNLETTAAATVSGSKIYLSPMLGLGLHDNPFKEPTRHFNIDLGAPHEETYILNFVIPVGFRAEEIPKSAKMSFGENMLSLDYFAEATPEKVKITVRNKMKNGYVIFSEYEDLKLFFAGITAKMEEQIVLTKI